MQSSNREIRRILVATKYRFIGDTLLAVPLIRALAEYWPKARITLLTGASAQELLEGCPYVADTICFDPYRKADEGFRRFFSVVRQVRHERFDIAFVCNRSFHSALIARLAGIPERVGWAGFQGRDFLLTRTVPYNDKAPEISSYLDLLGSSFPNAASFDFETRLELWISEAERLAMSLKVPQSPVHRVIGLQPGATHAEKRWPAKKYAEFMELFTAQEPGTEFILLGGPDEVAYAHGVLQCFEANAQVNARSFVGDLTLRQTLAALPMLNLFVGGDTAIRHAAMAVNTPTIALFGPTSAKKWGNAEPPRHMVLTAPSRRVEDIAVLDVLEASLRAVGLPKSGRKKGGCAIASRG